MAKIFCNRFLFNLYYQSYLYNRENQDEIDYKFKFGNIYIFECFFLSEIITIQEFISIYNDYERIFSKKKNKVLKLCLFNDKNGKAMVQYLIESKNYKFDINHFQLYIGKMCKRKADNSEFINYIIDCFKNHSFNYNCTNRIISKQEIEKQKSKPFSLKFQRILDCLENGKESCYKIIFDLSLDSIVDENGLDIPFKSYKNEIKTTRNQLLTRIVILGSNEMAKIYVNKFPNQQSKGGESLYFSHIRTYEKSIEPYETLVLNNILPCTHTIFVDYNILLKNSSVKYFKSFLENHLGFYTKVKGYTNPITTRIDEVKDLETLIYLENVRDKFKPEPLKFQSGSLLFHASLKMDFQLFKYLVESPFHNAKPTTLCYSDTSFDIVKYCFDNFQNYIFTDISFNRAFNGDLEFVKFIVDKFHSDGERILLSYRCIDRVCEKNYLHILIYILDNLPEIEISREPINDAIKNQNYEMVQLLKDRIPTKPKDKPTLYDSTIEKLKSYSKKDNRILSSLVGNPIYGKILNEKFGNTQSYFK
ncbi:hypothetical protein RB653_004130 [Dictyostelium firmibasis]|uniref:Uncharacterized protein n=1 Tax=Dictyostelium firmibasis TaxID=79012 RepID=A0AAN7Z333_9MYCE